MSTNEKSDLLDRCLMSNVRMNNEECEDCLINQRKNPISDYKGRDKRTPPPSCNCGICQEKDAENRKLEARANYDI